MTAVCRALQNFPLHGHLQGLVSALDAFTGERAPFSVSLQPGDLWQQKCLQAAGLSMEESHV